MWIKTPYRNSYRLVNLSNGNIISVHHCNERAEDDNDDENFYDPCKVILQVPVKATDIDSENFCSIVIGGHNFETFENYAEAKEYLDKLAEKLKAVAIVELQSLNLPCRIMILSVHFKKQEENKNGRD